VARLIAALSGGVDSAVAAALTAEAGHEVTAIHLALFRRLADYRPGSRGCCSLEDAHDARRVADALGLPFYVWDLSERFQEAVVEDFLAEYEAGRTPNPCLRCNESVKFAAVLERALRLGFDGIVTGHYASLLRRPDGTVELCRAADAAKDQSYVLAVMNQEQLRCSYFPLGGSLKTEVRAEAARRGFQVAAKPDSTDICFIPDGDTAGWLRGKLGRRPGPIRDESGAVVGKHEGFFAYTVGQRRGLRLGRPAADGQPRYVTKIDPAAAVVTVGPRSLLRVGRIETGPPLWCSGPPPDRFAAAVQFRAHGQALAADIQVEAQGAATAVSLREPAYGVAPGQTIVFYDGPRVVGSAMIDATAPPDGD
jgi:tRNA-specific 2-thiouridylase